MNINDQIFTSSNVFKGYYLPLAISLPSSLGAIFCGLLPQKYLHIDGLGLLNIYIEFVIRQSKVRQIMWLRRSKIGATMLFGLMNSLILYCLYSLRSNRFWFVNVGKEDENGNCIHGNTTCAEYLRKVSLFNSAIFPQKFICLHFSKF